MKVIIVGAGTTARSTADILSKDPNFQIYGFVGNKEEDKKLKGKNIYNNIPFLGSHEIIDKLIDDEVRGFVIAIGDNYLREKLYYFALNKGLSPINVISKNTIIMDSVNIGKGVIIKPGCIISNNVKISDNVKLDTNVIVEVDCNVGENSSVGSGSILGGASTIGRSVELGTRVVIESYIKIGKNNKIKSGTVCFKNFKDLPRKK